MSDLSGDSAAASVFVRVGIEEAFDVFTGELDLWWRHGRKYRIAGAKPGRMVLECRLGGQLCEIVDTPPRTFNVGKVLEWEPPRRLVLEWRHINFKPNEKTTVEVSFEARRGGTMVRVEHSGFAALPDNHPVRHGSVGAETCRHVGLWWGGLLTALREHVASSKSSPKPP